MSDGPSHRNAATVDAHPEDAAAVDAHAASFGEEGAFAAHLARLQRITSALSEAATHADIARVVVLEMAAVVGADQAILAVPIDQGARLLLLGHSGLRAKTIAEFGTFPSNAAIPVATAFDTGVPVWLPSPAAIAARYPGLVDIGRTRAIACMPLTLSGRRLGGIGLGFFAPRGFVPSDRALIDDLARQVALAMERARLYEEAKRGRDRLQLLLDAAARIAHARLDLGQILDAMASEVTRQLADACVISLRDQAGKHLELAAIRHIEPAAEAAIRQILRTVPIGIGHGIIGAVAQTGRSVLMASVPEDAFERSKPAYREHLARWPIASLIVVPLRSGGEILGTLSAARDRPGAPFTAEDERLLQELADRAALSIENALLYERAQVERNRAEDANRAKDEFLAMLGHELRNPLAPIRTALQLMRLRADDQLRRERTIIERQVNHMIRLVDDLLDVSRITRGKIRLERAPVELSDIVAKAVELASPLLEERSHQLCMSVSVTGMVVDADAHRLAQAIANLLTNAAKYTPPGGVIEVHARAREDAIELGVRDNGMGLDPALVPHVFDRFVQGHQALDRARGGLGLGLAIVRSLVEMHGGSVRAHSDGVGKGSEFAILLPPARARAQPGDAAPDIRACRPVVPRRASVVPRRILIVDDNRDAAIALEEVLRAVGHLTRVAYDGPTALDIAETFRPELALLDIGLPVMDGYELSRRLRALLGDAPPKLVAVTGYGQTSDRIRSRAAGFDEHLVKPIDLDQLEPVIDRLLAR